MVYGGNGFPLALNPNLSNASSLFISDPSRSVDFLSGIPDNLEFEHSSSSDRHSSSLHSASPELPKSPESVSIKPNSKHSRDGYSPFESPPQPDSFSSGEENTEFQDSSFINNTRAQFDLDISIDESKVVKGEPKLSPWLKFSKVPTQQGSLRHSSLLSKRMVTQNNITETSSTKRLEELTKQLTNCKIQLKLYEKFLQDLIDRRQIDIGELSEFHGNFTGKSISVLEQEHADMCALVEDLYASLEEFQGKWRDADKRVSDLDYTIRELAIEVSDLLNSIGDKLDIDPRNEPRAYLEKALPSLKEIIDAAVKETNEKHQKTIQSIKEEYETYKKENFNATRMLREQLLEIAKWKNDYGDLKEKFDELKNHSDDSEFKKLQSENDRLSSLNQVVDDKLHKYQVMINQLQKEVNEFKDLSRKGSLPDLSDPSVYTSLRDRDRYLLLQRDYDNLQRLYGNMASEFERFKETSASTISSLTNQLNNRKRDIISLRAERAVSDNIEHDLGNALEKQRVLTSEKMKLAWQVDTLTKDKASLESALDRMTQKVAGLGVKDGEESHKQLLDSARQQFETLFRLDVWEFQRLFKSFNKIADDSSLEGPKLKINTLVQAVSGKTPLENPGELSSLKDYHKSVFDYFARAVETIVNDHIRLLLKESEIEKNSSNLQVKKLEDKIASLEKQEELAQSKQTPGLILRIEELTNRWKVEREARVHDNEQAKRRLQQLEEENMRLRGSI